MKRNNPVPKPGAITAISMTSLGSVKLFKEAIMVQTGKIAKAVGIELRMPRQCGRLTQRPNYQSKTVEEYYCVAIFIPYLHSIIKTLGTWFVPDNKITLLCFLSILH